MICPYSRGPGLPVPRRRTFATAIHGLRSLDADCASQSASASASCLRWSATPALGTRATPHVLRSRLEGSRGSAEARGGCFTKNTASCCFFLAISDCWCFAWLPATQSSLKGSRGSAEARGALFTKNMILCRSSAIQARSASKGIRPAAPHGDTPPGRRRFRRSEIPTCHPGRSGTHNKSDILLVSSTFTDPGSASTRLRFIQARSASKGIRFPSSLNPRLRIGLVWEGASGFMGLGIIREGLPVSREPALLTSAGRMPKRRRSG